MFHLLPLDALPPSPASEDPLLQDPITAQTPLELPGSDLEDLGLVSRDEGYESYAPDEAPAEPLRGSTGKAQTQARTLSCRDLERKGLWQTDDCCDLCHSYAPVAPTPVQYQHVTVRGCCNAHDALEQQHQEHKDAFIARLFS